MSDSPPRCPWAGTDPLMIAYHDEEWGVPCHDDRDLFERLILEGFQAGLSWRTILHKRQAFRRAFADFDPERVAAFGAGDVARLLNDSGIVRNRLKIAGAIRNAAAFLEVQRAEGSFDRYVWSFVGGAPLVRGEPPVLAAIPASTLESDTMSKALKQRGFSFAGSTICYAFMQSVGMVNDHLATCFKTARPGTELSERSEPSV